MIFHFVKNRFFLKLTCFNSSETDIQISVLNGTRRECIEFTHPDEDSKLELKLDSAHIYITVPIKF